MPEVNCYFPIRLRITGRLNDAQLDQLGDALARALAERMAFADRTLAAHYGIEPGVGAELVRESYAPARADDEAGTYSVPSYDNGHGDSVGLRLHTRRRPWYIRTAINFHARVGAFLDFVSDLNPDQPLPGIVLYIDQYADLRWVSLWLVQVNQDYGLRELTDILFTRATQLSHLRSDQIMAYGLGTTENIRRQLIEVDEDGVVANEIPSLMPYNARRIENSGDDTIIHPGGRVLFASMVLPKIELSDLATLGNEEQVQVRLRDLTFLVPPVLFERRFNISWQDYIQELGDEPATLHLQPVTVLRRVHVLALAYLVEETVRRQLRDEHGPLAESDTYYGRLYVLNNIALGLFPPPVRGPAEAMTDAATRQLDEVMAAGDLEPDCKAAFVSTVLMVDDESLGIARYRPAGRRLASLLQGRLQGDPSDLAWSLGLKRFLEENFGLTVPEARPPGGTVFEFTLEELGRRGAFDLLFDMVESSGHFELQHLLLRLSLATRYAEHRRVQRLRQDLNARYTAGWEHTYRVSEQEIWLEQDPGQVVRRNTVIVDVNSLYSLEREEKRLKASSIPKIRQALEVEARELLDRILRGQDTNEYSDEEFAGAVLTAVLEHADRHHISEDDFEEITIERSVRLLGLEARTEQALENIYVTYDFVERVNGGPWEAVPDTRQTEFIGSRSGMIGEGFEQMLWFWRFNKTAAVVQYFAIGVTALGVIVVAWEAGVIAGAIELAGGGWSVLAAITISELFYFYRVIFRGEEFSWQGFFVAALDGYLAALAFRGAGFLGRGLAARIGVTSIRRLIVGWIAERLVVGSVGGAATGALTTFSHDLINIALEDGGWSSASQYIEHMSDGAVLGIAVEFMVGAAAPALRASGRNALETGLEMLRSLREGRIPLAQWIRLSTEALANMRRGLVNALEANAESNVIGAFRERLVRITEGLSAEYRLAVFRRVLELRPESFSPDALDGLERLLSASRADLSNEAVLALLNRLNPTQIRAFLEAVNTLDSPLVRALSRAGQLEALANAPHIADVIRHDPVLTRLILGAAESGAPGSAARIGQLVALARLLPVVPETFVRGAPFARGGTSQVYEVTDRPDLLVKQGGGRLPTEAQGLVELELMGIDTVYAATRHIEGRTNIVLRRIDGVGSKDIIGRLSNPLRVPQHVEIVTQRTIDDLERIYRVLQEHRANIGDFQFIVRRSDGAVFVNDPVSVNFGRGPSGNIRGIIDRFSRILRTRQAGGGE